LRCETPFGPEAPGRPYTSEFNVAKAIYTFNRDVRSGGIEADLCNPLEGLDQILHHILDKLDRGEFFDVEYVLPQSVMRIKPVKGFGIDLYDALKNLNRLLHQFYLIESVPERRRTIRAETALAGESINRYLKLDDAEKIEILKKIDPEQCGKELAEKR